MLSQWCQVVRDVTTIDEIRAATRPWLKLRHPPAVRVAVPGLSEVRTVALQAAIDKYGRACGCRAGKLGLAIAAALLAVAAVADPSLYDAGPAPVVTVVLAVLAAGALIGKFAGLLRAHAQLRRTVRTILA
jgi:hypothetical protein